MAFAHGCSNATAALRTEAFEDGVAALPEVLECFSVSGNADYVLRIVAPDLAAFSELMMKRVLRPFIANIKTDIVLGKVKQTHVLPLGAHRPPGRPRRGVRFTVSEAEETPVKRRRRLRSAASLYMETGAVSLGATASVRDRAGGARANSSIAFAPADLHETRRFRPRSGAAAEKPGGGVQDSSIAFGLSDARNHY